MSLSAAIMNVKTLKLISAAYQCVSITTIIVLALRKKIHFWQKSVYTYVYKDHLKDSVGQETVDTTEAEKRKNW